MKTPHTPGPWFWRKHPSGVLDLFAEDGARVILNNARLTNQAANSCLIAASPDLLQAVIDLLAVAPAKAPSAGLLVGIEKKHADALRSAKEAIAKATRQIP